MCRHRCRDNNLSIFSYSILRGWIMSAKANGTGHFSNLVMISLCSESEATKVCICFLNAESNCSNWRWQATAHLSNVCKICSRSDWSISHSNHFSSTCKLYNAYFISYDWLGEYIIYNSEEWIEISQHFALGSWKIAVGYVIILF